MERPVRADGNTGGNGRSGVVVRGAGVELLVKRK